MNQENFVIVHDQINTSVPVGLYVLVVMRIYKKGTVYKL
jgi:hypothetical protein